MGTVTTPQRVTCALPNAPTLINGFRFGHLSPELLLSEPLPEAEVAHLTSIPGYARMPANLAAETVAAVDEEIAAAIAAEKEAKAPSGASASVQQENEDLRAPNLAMTADRDQWRSRAQEAEAKLAVTAVPALEAQVKELAGQLATLRSAQPVDEQLVAAQQKIAQLEAANKALGDEVDQLKAKKPGKAA